MSKGRRGKAGGNRFRMANSSGSNQTFCELLADDPLELLVLEEEEGLLRPDVEELLGRPSAMLASCNTGGRHIVSFKKFIHK
jgi:hypothetical protein